MAFNTFGKHIRMYAKLWKSKQGYYKSIKTEHIYKKRININSLFRQDVYMQVIKTTCQKHQQCLLNEKCEEAISITVKAALTESR